MDMPEMCVSVGRVLCVILSSCLCFVCVAFSEFSSSMIEITWQKRICSQMLKVECFDIFNVFYNLFHLNASGYIEVRLCMFFICVHL